jgi:hypothetical protein
MENVSYCGTQSPWPENRKAVTANHGFEICLRLLRDQDGAANASYFLGNISVSNCSIFRMTQEVE